MQTTHHGVDNSVLKCRARHDTLAIDEVRLGAKSIGVRVVVVPDRKAVEMLENGGLWRAYEQIAQAIAIRTAGLGMTGMDLSRVRGCGSNIEYGAELLRKYDQWHATCRRKYISPLMILDMIVDGLSLKAVEKKYHFKAGAAASNLVKCLALWED